MLTPVVQIRITGYEASNLEKSRGMYERMKSHMSRHVDCTKSITVRSVMLLNPFPNACSYMSV